MRITTLRLRNFRSHVETMLELDRFNFLRGPNGCGKSSIQMALEYLFTGRCELTDGAGRGAEGLIRVGEKELEVWATLENGDTICRRRTSRSQTVEINGRRVAVDAAESFLTRHFGPVEAFSAVLNADRFVQMAEERQKRVLGQLIQLGKIELPNEIRDALRVAGEEDLQLASLRDVEAAYKRFLDLHGETEQALSALCQAGEAAAGPGLSDNEESGQQLEVSRCQLERVTGQTSEADICRRNAQLPSHEAEPDAGPEMDESLFEMPGLWEEGELPETESSSSHAQELRRELAELNAELEAVAASLLVVRNLKDKCPTCGQPVSEAAKVKEIDTLEERRIDLQDLIQRTQEELNCYSGPQAALGSGMHHRALSERVHLSDGRPGAQATRKPDRADAERQITVGPKSISRKERAPADVQQQPRTAETHPQTYASNKTPLEAKLHALERLTEFFGPNGPIMRETSRRMEQLRQDIDQRIASFGYACSWTPEPFEIRVSLSREGPALALRQLSESERLRFGIAFQVAAAAATGIRFLVIDHADVLDKPKRRMLTAVLLRSEIDQAIVLATGDEAPPEPIPAGVRFFDLARTKCKDAHSPEVPAPQSDHAQRRDLRNMPAELSR